MHRIVRNQLDNTLGHAKTVDEFNASARLFAQTLLDQFPKKLTPSASNGFAEVKALLQPLQARKTD